MKKLLLFTLLTLGGTLGVQAQTLVYRPQNPAFGGNTFNAQWLQASAQFQDKSKDPNAQDSNALNSRSGFNDANSLDDFSSTLSRQLLSRITSQLINAQFGEQALQEGTFQFGDLRVDITNAAEGVNIRIVVGKGGETTVTVPYF